MRALRPQLPSSSRLLPYLERIDEARYYSNRGPLLLEYERRMSEHFNCGVVAVSNCTAGLTASLLALDLPKWSYVAMPSWTFVATASAVCAAGGVPYFWDVDERRHSMWQSSQGIPCLPVSPFGAPVEFSNLQVLDAAAGFDTVRPGKHLTVVSTHATKVFGTGEGGLVLSADTDMLDRVREISNFGFKIGQQSGSYGMNREASRAGLNAKMSEYHAAVGLAELDGWSEKRERWLGVKGIYEELFKEFPSPVKGEWAASQYPIVLDCPVAPLAEKLGLRKVWGDGVHTLAAYREFRKTDLSVTEKLASNTLFLPIGIDITRAEQEEIFDVVEHYL